MSLHSSLSLIDAIFHCYDHDFSAINTVAGVVLVLVAVKDVASR